MKSESRTLENNSINAMGCGQNLDEIKVIPKLPSKVLTEKFSIIGTKNAT